MTPEEPGKPTRKLTDEPEVNLHSASVDAVLRDIMGTSHEEGLPSSVHRLHARSPIVRPPYISPCLRRVSAPAMR